MHIRAIAAAAMMFAALMPATTATACPFCTAVALTFTEEIDQSDVAVLASLVGPLSDKADEQYAIFQVDTVLKGEKFLEDQKKFTALFFGKQPPGTQFLLMGTVEGKINWGTPNALTERSAKYVLQLPKLPPKGADRLVFFQDYLEDADELLARDAFDEFARSDYQDVKELKPRMKREKYLGWVADSTVPASRRRGYFTLLGVCGKPEDAEMIRNMLTTPVEEPRTGVDAALACYLTLSGEQGLPFVESLYLANKDAEYTDTYAAIMALRFHGQSESVIPKKRLVESLRLLLNRPDVADLVIPDLARWEDWESMDRLVELFKNSDQKKSWVRIPVVQYLLACPLPQAKAHLEELRKIDEESVRRASLFLPLGGQGGAKPTDAKATSETPDDAS